MRISAAIALVATVATGFMVSVRAEANAEATVELNEKNFEDHIANRDLVMINFYTSWCGHCQTLGKLRLHCARLVKVVKFGTCDPKY